VRAFLEAEAGEPAAVSAPAPSAAVAERPVSPVV
jgi:hypothetical protein